MSDIIDFDESPEDGDAPIWQGTPATCKTSKSCSGLTRCGYPGFKRTKIEDGKVVPAFTCCPTDKIGGVTTGQVCIGIPSGFRCEKGKDVCANHACGHPGDKEKDVICCSSGKTYRFDGVSGGVGDTYCAETGKIGDSCVTSRGCEGGSGCGHPGSQEEHKICCANGAFLAGDGKSYCIGLPDGSVCPDARGCENGCCKSSKCSPTNDCDSILERIGIFVVIIIVIIIILIILYIIFKVV